MEDLNRKAFMFVKKALDSKIKFSIMESLDKFSWNSIAIIEWDWENKISIEVNEEKRLLKKAFLIILASTENSWFITTSTIVESWEIITIENENEKVSLLIKK